ncbi:MAG TPA: aminoacyl-tRNA hydrolase [Nitrospirae bacterium]|nr:peptidyl-tRNA hydrolase [bacterium BMS3Abin10]GBE40059.1 peptidyl-tRNA hydrolase [bacterium BMS3Bbin08]HDH51435.1 aminoacyl-tRNA hydrolase [Nitrospirota bacterium]HDK82140.1 aminoacyl-tRNA hydrolase [Nitrospirota bacterium]HDO25700.1 aminoacyl-tRNA hydrolase [Nitrospirota bacterium]
MWLIVGLGNPGRKYAKTRHNLGFMVIDALSSKLSISLENRSKNLVCGRGAADDEEITLIKPLTFMNRSGSAVREAVRKHKYNHKLLVIYDDIDLSPGVLRIKRNGSAGGHRGVESVIESLGSKNFPRVKIGIGKSDEIPAEDYVLGKFKKNELSQIKKAVDRAAEAVLMIIAEGISPVQNRFHKSL